MAEDQFDDQMCDTLSAFNEIETELQTRCVFLLPQYSLGTRCALSCRPRAGQQALVEHKSILIVSDLPREAARREDQQGTKAL